MVIRIVIKNKKRKSDFKMVNLATQLQCLLATAVWFFMPHSSLLHVMNFHYLGFFWVFFSPR